MGIGAGILPMAINDGKVYFLFSRERNLGDFKEKGLWSDFGGKDENGETSKQDLEPLAVILVNTIFHLFLVLVVHKKKTSFQSSSCFKSIHPRTL